MTFALMMASLLSAHAGHHDHGRHGHDKSPEIEVDNDLPVPVNVWIDGRYMGQLERGKRRDYDVRPGQHEVQVADLQGTVVLNTWVVAPYRGEIEVEVKDPFGSLHVHNESNAPLFVQVHTGAPGIWLNPGDKGTLRAPAGTVGVTASVDTGRGLQAVHQDQVGLRRGRTTHYDLEWYAPPVAPARPASRPVQPARPAVQTVSWRPAAPARPSHRR